MTAVTTGPATTAGGQAGSARTLRRPPSRIDLWWLSPVGTLALVVPLSLLVAVRISDADYRFFYKEPRVVTSDQALLFLLAATVLGLTSMLASSVRATRRPRQRWPGFSAGQLAVLGTAEQVAFAMTSFGYLALAALGVARGARPSLIVGAITSQSNYTGQLKTVFAPVAGVSSFTQIGVAYVVIAGLLLAGGRQARLIRRLSVVLVLGLLRAYLLTERLAVLELLVPLIAVGAVWLRQQPRRGGWLPLAPVLAIPVLLVVFGAFEYSRSWVFYRTRTTLSFPAFVVNRLAGYYATSYNNGALQLDYGRSRGRLPYSSLEALWTAPGAAQLDLYRRLTGQGGSDALNTVLQQHGNPEFNNPGGLAVPLFDFGILGGLVFFAVAGLLLGLAHHSWRSGNPLGLLVYPVLFTGILELPRYLYWTQGRVVPPLVFLLVVAGILSRQNRGRFRRATVP